MKSNRRISIAMLVASTVILTGAAAHAGELNPRQNTANLEYGKVLKIRLPYGLCEFENVVPTNVVAKLSTRSDWNRLVEYMLVNCPNLGLPLADTATASITEAGAGSDDDASGDSTGSGGSGDDTTGGGSDDDSTGGGDTSDDDGNNGHGNDADGHDESNPGKGR